MKTLPIIVLGMAGTFGFAAYSEAQRDPQDLAYGSAQLFESQLKSYTYRQTTSAYGIGTSAALITGGVLISFYQNRRI